MSESNWLGKKLKYRDTNSPGNTVIEQKDGMVHFDNNSMVPQEKVGQLFEEVRNVAVDPDSFFERSNPFLSTIANQIKNIPSEGGGSVVNPSVHIPTSDNYTGPTSESVISSRPLQQGDELWVPPVVKKPIAPQNNHGIPVANQPVQNPYDQYANNTDFEDDGGEVTRINTEDLGRKPIQNRNNQGQQISRPPLKKTTPITLKLEIVEMIPKIEAIRNYGDLFDDPIIEILAKEIVQKYINDPALLEEIIKEKLEAMIFPVKKKKAKKKKKPAVKSIKKETVSNESSIQKPNKESGE